MSISNASKKHAEMTVLSKLQSGVITPEEASALLEQVKTIQDGEVSMSIDYDKGVVVVKREKIKGAPKHFTPEEIDSLNDYWVDELRRKGDLIRKKRGF